MDRGVHDYFDEVTFADLELGPQKPASCADELYNEGKGFDRGLGKSYFAANGLYENHNFTLKPYTTCVKYQGERGSCTAFAQVAALESVIAKTKKQWLNLSEQHLYWRAKTAWEPSLYADGANSGGFGNWGLAEGFRVGKGTAWLYNQSLDREENVAGYKDSCLGSSRSKLVRNATILRPILARNHRQAWLSSLAQDPV